MIPKIIHYCWFGNNPLPELAKRCIDSWKKYCPDYKIIEWNELNFDINSNKYIKEAYEHKKYAFVADYARFAIIQRCGGIYMDTDVEMIRAIPKKMLQHNVFLGCEEVGRINPGLILGGEKNNFFCQTMVKDYDNYDFVLQDGNLNLTTIVDYTTNKIAEMGWEDKKEVQSVNGIVIYPVDYFCPKSLRTGKIKITENTISIHHFDASWISEKEKKRNKKQLLFNRIFGYKLGSKLLGSFYYLKEHSLKATIKHTIKTIKGKK